jgi:hypothetical protein
LYTVGSGEGTDVSGRSRRGCAPLQIEGSRHAWRRRRIDRDGAIHRARVVVFVLDRDGVVKRAADRRRTGDTLENLVACAPVLSSRLPRFPNDSVTI